MSCWACCALSKLLADAIVVSTSLVGIVFVCGPPPCSACLGLMQDKLTSAGYSGVGTPFSRLCFSWNYRDKYVVPLSCVIC